MDNRLNVIAVLDWQVPLALSLFPDPYS
jgi:hypothetical protein